MLYLDSSALVKLVVDEAETEALRELARNHDLLSSKLAVVEVARAARRYGLEARAADLVRQIVVVEVDDAIFGDATHVEPATLGALDAIHLVSALAHRERLDAFITYDARLLAAAEAAGLPVASPR